VNVQQSNIDYVHKMLDKL